LQDLIFNDRKGLPSLYLNHLAVTEAGYDTYMHLCGLYSSTEDALTAGPRLSIHFCYSVFEGYLL